MKDKIKILIYGNKLSLIATGGNCGHSEKDCGNCSSCNKEGSSGCSGCGDKEKDNKIKNWGDAFLDLENYFKVNDLKDSVEIEFIELEAGKIGANQDIEEVIERGFEPPITVIDGIIRYFGAISNVLIYNDVKELLQ